MHDRIWGFWRSVDTCVYIFNILIYFSHFCHVVETHNQAADVGNYLIFVESYITTVFLKSNFSTTSIAIYRLRSYTFNEIELNIGAAWRTLTAHNYIF